MSTIKTAGMVILGLAGFVGLLFVAFFLIGGTAFIADKILPYLIDAGLVVLGVCIVALLPLSIFRATRVVSLWGFFIASYIFGLCVWMEGFLVTYNLWGPGGVFIGLFLFVVGVVPLGIIAAGFHGMWLYVGDLVGGVALTYGARVFAMFLMHTLDRPPRRTTSAGSTQTLQKRGVFMRLVRAAWKTVAVVLAIVIGIFASAATGWNGGSSLLGYSEGAGSVANLAVGLVGFLGCLLLSYFVFRIAKRALWLLVPIMLYCSLVLGIWDGIASDFDAVRLEVIRHQYATAGALQHMSAHAFELTCHDTGIELTKDAQALCDGPPK
jgi:hypothetical protein